MVVGFWGNINQPDGIAVLQNRPHLLAIPSSAANREENTAKALPCLALKNRELTLAGSGFEPLEIYFADKITTFSRLPGG
jgi:hypothetical protein